MQTRKHTAWKKNRKFSVIHGGRERLSMHDNIFKREHNLFPPTKGEEIPIFMVDNTSRNYFHPIGMEDIKHVLAQLPKKDVAYLTHIWLKSKPFDFTLQTNHIWGRGVDLIVLYAFPCNLQMRIKHKPTEKDIREHEKYSKEWKEDKDGWYLEFTAAGIKQFYIEKLLLYSVGHMVNTIWLRYAKNSSNKKTSDFAMQYANNQSKNLKTSSNIHKQ
jgi:hypothetical protein